MNLWDTGYAWDVLPALLDGLRVTILATLIAYAIALVLGLVWTLLRRAPSMIVRQTVRWVTEFIRSTPLIPQLFFVYFVFPDWGLTLSSLTAGIITLGVHYSTYTAEVYRAGIADVPKGQWEACTALNLPKSRVWVDVIIPQAVRRVIPTLGNYLIATFKDTPMLLAISVHDVLFVAFDEGAETLRYLEPLTVAGLIFVFVSVISSIIVRRLEGRYATN